MSRRTTWAQRRSAHTAGMTFEGGDPIDKCWASNHPFSLSEYAACDRATGLDALGLCPAHRASIVPAAQPAPPALVVPSLP